MNNARKNDILFLYRQNSSETIAIIEYETGESKHDVLFLPSRIEKKRKILQVYIRGYGQKPLQESQGLERVYDLMVIIENKHLVGLDLFLIEYRNKLYSMGTSIEYVPNLLTKMYLTEVKNREFELQKVNSNVNY